MNSTLRWIVLLLSWGFLFLEMQGPTVSEAQEDVYILADEAVFGALRRPPVVFSHEKHVDSLGDNGCGSCHHVQDPQTGRLVYREGEEAVCSACHFDRETGDGPALREAYHGNCTGCHRKRVWRFQPSGPTTCGGCHRPG